jgi:hypothetical protein
LVRLCSFHTALAGIFSQTAVRFVSLIEKYYYFCGAQFIYLSLSALKVPGTYYYLIQSEVTLRISDITWQPLKVKNPVIFDTSNY